MSKLQLFHGRLWKCICFHLFPLPFQWHSNYNFNSSVKKIFWQQRKTLMMIEICLSSPSPLALLFCKPPGLLFFILLFFAVFVTRSLSQASREQNEPLSSETVPSLPGGDSRTLIFPSSATILLQPWKAANGGYCFFAGYGFVLDPCAKCKHVISPHLLYPKTFPMSIFDFQVHLCTDWNPPNMLLHKCKPTHCWFWIKCSYASTLPFQSLPQSCSMCPFNTFFPAHKEIPVFIAEEHGAVFSILFLFIPWSLLLFSQLIYPLFTAHMCF